MELDYIPLKKDEDKNYIMTKMKFARNKLEIEFWKTQSTTYTMDKKYIFKRRS